MGRVANLGVAPLLALYLLYKDIILPRFAKNGHGEKSVALFALEARLKAIEELRLKAIEEDIHKIGPVLDRLTKIETEFKFASEEAIRSRSRMQARADELSKQMSELLKEMLARIPVRERS